jgi:hypothetical protein
MSDEFTDVGMRQAASAVLAMTATAWSVHSQSRHSQSQRRVQPATSLRTGELRPHIENVAVVNSPRIDPEPPRTLQPA